METFFIIAGIVLFTTMWAEIYRVMAGPTAIDRIVAVNVIGTKTTVLLVFIGTIFGRVDMFVDFALAYGLLNFVGSLAASRYFHRCLPYTTPIDAPEKRKKTSGGNRTEIS